MRVEHATTSPLFQLLPAFYLASLFRKALLGPEMMLVFAVLEDAVRCFQTSVLTRGSRFSEAEDWILDKSSDWPFSFENICAVLGLDPTYMRRGLLHWKERTLAGRPEAKFHHYDSPVI